MDIYGENTIYLSNEEVRLYSYFEYLLDVIETNLNCYSSDFFRNEKNFGVDGLNLQDPSSVKSAIDMIIKNRLSGVNISVSNVDVSDSQILVSLSGSFGLEQVEISVSDQDKDILKIQKIQKV